MKGIWCGLSAMQLGDEEADLVVFPEGVAEEDIADVSRQRPAAVVAGAYNDGQGSRMRGVIWHGGREQIAYEKVSFDQRTPGGPPPGRPPIYVTNRVAIGLAVCCDIQQALFNDIIAQLSAAQVGFKAICIPADMWDPSWFSGDARVGYESWGAVHVVLSNGLGLEGGARPPSFITDESRQKVAVQQGLESISWVRGCHVDRSRASQARPSTNSRDSSSSVFPPYE